MPSRAPSALKADLSHSSFAARRKSRRTSKTIRFPRNGATIFETSCDEQIAMVHCDPQPDFALAAAVVLDPGGVVIEWKQISNYCLQSDCKQYTVPKIGGARGWTYESWFRKEQLAVGFLTPQAAKDHCETHQRQQMRAA